MVKSGFQNIRSVFARSKAGFLLRKILIVLLSRIGVTEYEDTQKNDAVFTLIRQVRKESGLALSDMEAFQIAMAVEKTQKIFGDIAEVGVYTGGSTKIIAEKKGHKNLFLFDTFEGLPAPDMIDIIHTQGQFAASFERVREYLSKYPGIFFFKGIFPSTAGPVKDTAFAFVHIDVDLYQSTRDCLAFFYPRMSPGGVIISHDYSIAPGVKKAVDEFFSDKSEIVLEIFGSQCLIVKVSEIGTEIGR